MREAARALQYASQLMEAAYPDGCPEHPWDITLYAHAYLKAYQLGFDAAGVARPDNAWGPLFDKLMESPPPARHDLGLAVQELPPLKDLLRAVAGKDRADVDEQMSEAASKFFTSFKVEWAQQYREAADSGARMLAEHNLQSELPVQRAEIIGAHLHDVLERACKEFLFVSAEESMTNPSSIYATASVAVTLVAAVNHVLAEANFLSPDYTGSLQFSLDWMPGCEPWLARMLKVVPALRYFPFGPMTFIELGQRIATGQDLDRVVAILGRSIVSLKAVAEAGAQGATVH